MVRRHTPDDQALGAALATLQKAVRDLQVVDGTQLARSVQKVKDLIVVVEDRLNQIPAEVDAALDSIGVYTVAEVDALIANPPGNVTTTGRGTFSTGLTSTGVYNQLVTYGGSYRAVWAHEDGTLGYAPSSGDLKTPPAPFRVTIEDALRLQAVTFRYLPTPPYKWGREELGGIAQEVEAAGFPWLVDRDENGEPYGLRNDLIGWVVLEGMRDLVTRLGVLPE